MIHPVDHALSTGETSAPTGQKLVGGVEDYWIFPWFVALTLNPTQPTLIPWYLSPLLGFLGYQTGNSDVELVGDTQNTYAGSGL